MVCKKAFTLVEVMIATMIVSVVIGAFLKIEGNTNHLFMQFGKSQKRRDFSTLFLWNHNYGFESSRVSLYAFVEDFAIDDDLRRELKKEEITTGYKRVKTIESQILTLEVGESCYVFKDFNISFGRVILR